MDEKAIKKIIQKEVNPLLIGIRNDLAQNLETQKEIAEQLKKKSQLEYELEIDNDELKGADGHTPTADELLKLITPLIPPAKKGDDGHTPTGDELKALIVPLIPAPKDPSYTKVLTMVKPLIEANFKSHSTIFEQKLSAIKKAIPTYKEMTAQDIVSKLESLKGARRLDAKAIKGLEKYIQTIIVQSGGGGAGSSSSGGAVSSVNGATGVVVLTTADIADSADKRYVTDAQLTVISNTSGTNTGDQDLSSYATSASVAATYIPLSQKGANSGVAELDSGGKVPTAQLPAYVDDVVEAANFAALPATGETGKIYVTLDDNKTYRWSGSAYVEISASLALGETSATAYRGDRGKTAYDHSQLTTGNPHNVLATQITDFDTEVANNSAVAANTAKVTNATHTGDVTGDTALTIANDAVTNAKLANMAQNTIKGRITASTGDPEDLTAANVRTITETETTTQLNTRDTNNRARANHTGTQTASTISDFDAEVSNNTDVAANTTARHTHANKALLDTYTQTEADIADAISKEHTHSNKTILDNTTASFTTAQETKLSNITVTQAVDLDQMETDIAALANGMVYKGDWDASAGTFPAAGAAQAGWFYYVSVAGTVDGVVFAVGDNLVATVDNASSTVYAANWSKHDQTDAVSSVNGQVGSVVLDADDIDDTSTTNKFATAAEKTKLSHISVTQAVDLDTIESDTATNNAKVTNATHTGDVTGSGALTIDVTAITNKLEVTIPTTSDQMLIETGGVLKKIKLTNLFSIFGQIPIGGVIDWAGTTLPTGYLYCDGSVISRTTYADLFTVIGTTYGAGDGSTTFALPDARGRVTAGMDNMNNVAGTGGGDAGRLTSTSKAGVDGDTLGAAGGVEEHLLLDEESGVPAHSHPYLDYYHVNDNAFANGTVNRQRTLTNANRVTSNNTPRDAAEAHTNVQPTLVLNKIIRFGL